MSTYKFEEINLRHNEKMKNSLQNIKEQFDWENDNLTEYFAGNLPVIRPTSEDKDSINIKLFELNSIYNSYNYFTTDRTSFIKEIETKLNEIHEINQHWYGLSLDTVKYYTDLHHACILTGEGGIGKSYFIYQLEKEISKNKIRHLCFYGKYQETKMDIDFEEILSFSETNSFIFILDAFNELSEENKNIILSNLPDLLKNRNIRVIITYRTYALSKEYSQKLSELISTKLSFPGISFESAIDVISKYPIKDVYKYSDILFSNNALLISKLITILTTFPEDKNSICSVTYILEHDFIETIGKEYWQQTKNITKWLYANNSKEIPLSEIAKIIKNPNTYIEKLIAAGFIYTYSGKKEMYIGFQIESMHDYLIARSLFDNVNGKTDDEIINILSEKLNVFPSAREAFILCLFDKFDGNYERICTILKKTKLLEELVPETIRKSTFNLKIFQLFFQFLNQNILYSNYCILLALLINHTTVLIIRMNCCSNQKKIS